MALMDAPQSLTGYATPTGYTQSVGPSSLQTQEATNQQQATNSTVASSYIPDYAEAPMLRQFASTAAAMAPQVYQWGMDQYNKNQGNIDTMMRNALTYASPQRIAAEMGQAEATSQQAAEAGRQSAIKDLQSYGIDPSSGRYAALDTANRVMAGAAAAGAGNVQREATTAAGIQQQQAAQQLSETNYQQGYGASAAANALLGTAMSLKFPPLGQTSVTQGQSTGSGQSAQMGVSGGQQSTSQQFAPPESQLSQAQARQTTAMTPYMSVNAANAANRLQPAMVAAGGYIPPDLSPSDGQKVDDIPAQLNAGEFVIPKDVADWKGQEFFYKLMAQARKTRAMGGMNGNNGGQPSRTGYQAGGGVAPQLPFMHAGRGGGRGGGRGIAMQPSPFAPASIGMNVDRAAFAPPAIGYQAGGFVGGTYYQRTPDYRDPSARWPNQPYRPTDIGTRIAVDEMGSPVQDISSAAQLTAPGPPASWENPRSPTGY